MLELSHKKMTVWKKSLKLIRGVYKITEQFPAEENFGLTSLLRRASVSVISNISEGEARRTRKEKRRFYEIACSSIVELASLVNECFAMLSKLKTTR